MKRLLPAVLSVVLAACSLGEAVPTSSTSSTTTTIVDDTCDRVAGDAVTLVEDMIATLDETRLVEFRDRADWPEELVRLERLGADVDIRVAALGCDPAAIRLSVLEQADLSSRGPLGGALVTVLLDPPTPEEVSAEAPPGDTTPPGETTGG